MSKPNIIKNKIVGTQLQHKLLSLRSREIEIILLIAKGYNSKEIAHKLYLSNHTIKSHRKNILRKLEAQSSAEMIHKCHLMGVLVCPKNIRPIMHLSA